MYLDDLKRRSKYVKLFVLVAATICVFFGSALIPVKTIQQQQKAVYTAVQNGETSNLTKKISFMGVEVQEFTVQKNESTQNIDMKVTNKPIYQSLPYIFASIITVAFLVIVFVVRGLIKKSRQA